MDRSTPITHLRSHGEQDTEAAEMMDNIVHDIEEEDQQQQPMPPRMQQQQQQFPGHYGPMQPGMMHGNGPMMPPQHMMQPPPQMMQQHQQRMPQQQQHPLENPPMSQRILSEAKEPLLVSVLVMIMSSGHLQSLIARFLPIASSNPLIGLAVRAILAGVLFYLLRRFIPSA